MLNYMRQIRVVFYTGSLKRSRPVTPSFVFLAFLRQVNHYVTAAKHLRKILSTGTFSRERP